MSGKGLWRMLMLGQRQDTEYTDVVAYERVRSTSPALCVIYEYTIMSGQGLRYFVSKLSEAHTSCVLSVAGVLCMRSTNWKVQPYIRNRVDSEGEHSDTVTPETEIDDFKKNGERSMLFFSATRTLLMISNLIYGKHSFEDSAVASKPLKPTLLDYRLPGMTGRGLWRTKKRQRS